MTLEELWFELDVLAHSGKEVTFLEVFILTHKFALALAEELIKEREKP